MRTGSRHRRLVTVHDYGYCRQFPDPFDFISVQLWGSELHSIMRKVRDDFPGKPVLNIEHGGYERSLYVVFSGVFEGKVLTATWFNPFTGVFDEPVRKDIIHFDCVGGDVRQKLVDRIRCLGYDIASVVRTCRPGRRP